MSINSTIMYKNGNNFQTGYQYKANISNSNLDPFQAMSDVQDEIEENAIQSIALDMAKNNARKSFSYKALKILPVAAITAFVAISGAKTPGTLSKKLSTAGTQALYFALGGTVIKGLGKAYNKIDTKKAKEGKAINNSPLKTIGRIALDIGAIIGIFLGAKKGIGIVSKHAPKLTNSITDFGKRIADTIDKSVFQKWTKNIQKSYQSFSAKHPKLTDFASKNSTLGVFAGYILGSLGLNILNESNIEKNAKKNYNELKAKQENFNQLFSFNI